MYNYALGDDFMLNEERIKEQYQLALLDRKEGKTLENHRVFYRGDYISKELLKSFFSGTIFFMAVTLLMLFSDLDRLMIEVNKIDYEVFAMQFVAVYLAFISVYLIITYVIYALRYEKQKHKVKIYRNHLKKLNKLYAKDEKDK